MSWKKLTDLVFLWWNTGLTPPVKRVIARSHSDVEFVCAELSKHYQVRPFHILGLCEVSESNVKDIVAHLGEDHFDYHFHPRINNRVIADTAVIFDVRYVELIDSQVWIDSYGSFETIKVAEVLSFYVAAIDEFLFVVTSHWPSQLTYSENSPHRAEIASGCRKRIEELRREHQGSDYIVLMGDYNAEPFSDPMSKHLLATRDRRLVEEDNRFLYNPFWRRLGESLPHAPDTQLNSIGGSCFYSSDKYRRWASFDQIIFSSAFLQNGSMVLDEVHSDVLAPDSLRLIIEKSEFIDHYPVTSTVQIRSKSE